MRKNFTVFFCGLLGEIYMKNWRLCHFLNLHLQLTHKSVNQAKGIFILVTGPGSAHIVVGLRDHIQCAFSSPGTRIRLFRLSWLLEQWRFNMPMAWVLRDLQCESLATYILTFLELRKLLKTMQNGKCLYASPL